jgi:hypothetical protein
MVIQDGFDFPRANDEFGKGELEMGIKVYPGRSWRLGRGIEDGSR